MLPARVFNLWNGNQNRPDGRTKTPARDHRYRNRRTPRRKPSAGSKQRTARVSFTVTPSQCGAIELIIIRRSVSFTTEETGEHPHPMSDTSVTAKPISKMPTSSHQIKRSTYNRSFDDSCLSVPAEKSRWTAQSDSDRFQAAWAKACKFEHQEQFCAGNRGIQAANQEHGEQQIAHGQR